MYKENCPNNTGTLTSRDVIKAPRDVITSSPYAVTKTLTPTLLRKSPEEEESEDVHNEIFVQMGDHVHAHTLQVLLLFYDDNKYS